MLIGLLGIVMVYGLAAAGVYAVYVYRRKQGIKPATLIVCVTHDHAGHIEWYVRTFLFVSAVRNRSIEIKVLDQDSKDETIEIVTRLAKSSDHVTVLRSYEELERLLEGRSPETYRIIVLGGEHNPCEALSF